MFCKSCSASISNEASFCKHCGKPIADASRITKQRVVPEETRLSSLNVATKPAPVSVEVQKRNTFGEGLRRWLLILFIGGVLVYPLKDGDNIRDAVKNEVTQQAPYALDILVVRHPVKVGLLHSLLNDQGQMDRAAQEYVLSSMNIENVGVVRCYAAYYYVLFDKDDIRTALADKMEKDFGLQD
jgi:hypothetical protein